METTSLDEIYRFPTVFRGGLAVHAIPGQGAGEVYADGDVTTAGAIRATGAEVTGACSFGSPDCTTTILGALHVAGEVTGPSSAPRDRATLRAAPNTWAEVPVPAGAGRLLFIMAETSQTSAAFFVALGAPGAVVTLFRETGSSSHIVLRNDPGGLFAACLTDAASGSEAAGGITSAIREKVEAPTEPSGEPTSAECSEPASESKSAENEGSRPPDDGLVEIRLRLVAC